MIGKLKGIIDSIEDDQLILDVNGVGYLVYCSSNSLRQLPGVGEAASLTIETHVREDHFHLYGFATIGERDWFRELNKVNGVGTRMALAILSALSPEQISQALAAQDKTMFTQVSGVGPKLATRLVTELKDKTVSVDLSSTNLATTSSIGNRQVADDSVADAVSALVNLGYGRTDAHQAVLRASAQDESGQVGELIRLGLKELGS